MNPIDPSLIPSDDMDPAPYVPKTLQERMSAFTAEVIQPMIDTPPPPAPAPAQRVIYRPALPSLEKERECVSCHKHFVGLLPICGDCADARMELRAQAEARAKGRKRARVWCEVCPQDYRYTDWANPALSPVCVDLALHWVPTTTHHSLGLHGESRIGKTRAAFAILSRFHEMGWDVFALHAGDAWDKGADIRGLSSAVRLQHDDSLQMVQGARAALLRARSCSLLLIDDMGKERTDTRTGLLTEAVSEAFYSLLEYRLANRAPIIWTCNSDAKTLLHRLGEERGLPFMNRLSEISHTPDLSPE